MPNKDRATQLESQRRHYREHKEQYAQRQRDARDKVREYLDDIKKRSRCKCGISDYRLLVFHHRDPNEKEVSIGQFHKCKWSHKRIDVELAKCDVMCAHCHLLLHWRWRQEGIEED